MGVSKIFCGINFVKKYLFIKNIAELLLLGEDCAIMCKKMEVGCSYG